MNLTAAHNDKVRTKVTEMLTRGKYLKKRLITWWTMQMPAYSYVLPFTQNS